MVKWLNKYFAIVIVLSFVQNNYSQNKTDSLKQILKTCKPDTNKIKILNDISWNLLISGNYDSAITYSNRAINVAITLNLDSSNDLLNIAIKKGHARALNNIGNIYFNRGNYRDALNNYLSCLSIQEKISHKKGLAGSYGNIANVYKNLGNYPQALTFYFKALKMQDEMGDKKGIATCYNNIGSVYFRQANLRDAYKNYSAALILFEEIGYKIGMAIAADNVGNIYDKRGDSAYVVNNSLVAQFNYSNALEKHLISLKIKEEIGDKKGISTSYMNIALNYAHQANSSLLSGNIHSAKVKFEEAIKYNNEALKIQEETDDKEGMAVSLANMGAVYTSLKKYTIAEDYSKKAMVMARKMGDLETVKDVSKNLSDLYNSIGKYSASLEFYKIFIAVRDSLTNEENTKKTVQQQMQYDFDKKDSETKAEQNKKDVIANEEKQKQKIIISSVSVGLILVLILAIVIFRSLRQNQKKNKIITEQKEIVERQKELVEEKQKEILDSIHYAKRIQTALITSEKYIDKCVKRLNT